jgi:hypothetical protein
VGARGTAGADILVVARREDQRSALAAGSYCFDDPLAALYVACSDAPVSVSALRKRLSLKESDAEIEAALSEFCQLGLMMQDGPLYLALAVPGSEADDDGRRSPGPGVGWNRLVVLSCSRRPWRWTGCRPRLRLRPTQPDRAGAASRLGCESVPLDMRRWALDRLVGDGAGRSVLLNVAMWSCTILLRSMAPGRTQARIGAGHLRSVCGRGSPLRAAARAQ